MDYLVPDIEYRLQSEGDNSRTGLTETMSSSYIVKEKSSYFGDTPYTTNEGQARKYNEGQTSTLYLGTSSGQTVNDEDFFDVVLDSSL